MSSKTEVIVLLTIAGLIALPRCAGRYLADGEMLCRGSPEDCTTECERYPQRTLVFCFWHFWNRPLTIPTRTISLHGRVTLSWMRQRLVAIGALASGDGAIPEVSEQCAYPVRRDRIEDRRAGHVLLPCAHNVRIDGHADKRPPGTDGFATHA